MNYNLFHFLITTLWSIFLILLFGGGSIFVHELGHFIVARRYGLKVDSFSIGFGPALWRRYSKDGIEYRLSVLPFGGYVTLPQLANIAALEGGGIPVSNPSPPDTVAERTTNVPEPSYSTKMVVFVAGAFFNVLFALLLAIVLWIIGQQTSENLSTTRIGYIPDTIQLPSGKNVTSPAREAGFQVGDTILSLDGRQVSNWAELLNTLITSSNVATDGRREVVFSVLRDGKPKDITVHPILVTKNCIRRIGILAAYTPIVASVPEKSFTKKIGLQAGDKLIKLDGKPLLNLFSLYDTLQAKPAKPLILTIVRSDRMLDLTVPADHQHDANSIFGTDFRIKTGLIHENPFSQLGSQLRMTWRFAASLLKPKSDIGIDKLTGPIGIGHAFWKASKSGIRYVFWITTLVNINLAIFNLLPLPILDGGQMLFATISKLRGKTLPPNLIATANSVTLILLLSLIIYVGFFDIQHIRHK